MANDMRRDVGRIGRDVGRIGRDLGRIGRCVGRSSGCFQSLWSKAMEVDLCLYYAIKNNRFESKTFHTAIKK